MEHWTEDFEHSSITGDNREAFNSSMAKYATQADAIVGGHNAQKLAGKPFKLPESMNNLPDDATRKDLTTQAYKLLGISPLEHAVSVDDFADVNFKDGLAEGAEVNEDLASVLKTWAVAEKIDKASLGKILKFYNGPLGEYAGKIQTAKAEKVVADKVAAAKACNEALAAHADFGSEDKVKEQSVLMTRALLNNVGLTPDEAASVTEAMVGSVTDTNPILKRVLLKTLAPLAAESSNQSGGGHTPPAKGVDPDEGSPAYVASGWSTPEQAEAYKQRNKAPA